MLEVRRLRLLYELERRGTIAAVAEALHFSPSGVSQQLAQLESEVGVPLLERVGRGVRLTDAGRLLAGHAGAVIRQLERAEAELSATRDRPGGTVRIAAFQTAALALVPPMLDRLAAHPGLRVELAQAEPEQALPALLARDFDLIVSEEYPGVPAPVSGDVDRVDLCQDEMELVLPLGDGSARDADPLAPSADQAWVMEPPGTMSREWATNVCRAAGFEPAVVFESGDMLVHRELAARGHAAAFLPRLLSQALPTALATHPMNQARTIFTLVRRGRETHASILAVREALGEALRDSAAVNRQLR